MLVIKTGDPGGTRTTGLRFRKPPLYPAELRGHTPQINILGKVPRAIVGDRRVLDAWPHLGPVLGRYQRTLLSYGVTQELLPHFASQFQGEAIRAYINRPGALI